METKVCSKCGRELPVEMFAKNKTRKAPIAVIIEKMDRSRIQLKIPCTVTFPLLSIKSGIIILPFIYNRLSSDFRFKDIIQFFSQRQRNEYDYIYSH